MSPPMSPAIDTPTTDDAALPRTVPSYMCAERRSVAARLGVTEDQLKKAVRAVGSKLNSVRIYLGK
jgi:hypothetical protein